MDEGAFATTGHIYIALFRHSFQMRVLY